MSRKLARFSQWLRSQARVAEPAAHVQLEDGGAFVPPPKLAPAPARERDRRALALSVFDPVHPVKHRGELCGRDAELEILSTAVLDQGKHAIIHGARGSGKTSLVQVFGAQADEAGAVVVYLAAEAKVRFDELLAAYMRFIPDTALTLESRANLAARTDELKRAVRSQEMVELLQTGLVRQLVLVLDEFDRVTDRRVQVELATFMKLVADTRAPVQFVIVGIARSVEEIIEHHPSLRRHLAATPVRRLSDAGLRRLVEQGGEQCGLTFTPPAISLIARVAAGSPYHARLFALEAALAALKEEAETVGVGHVRDGLGKAIGDWSRLNVEEHAFFSPLVRLRPELRSSFIEVAEAAALADELASSEQAAAPSPEVDSELDLLNEVRRRLKLDSLAPQFLLAMIEFAEGGEATPDDPASTVDLPRPAWETAQASTPEPAPVGSAPVEVKQQREPTQANEPALPPHADVPAPSREARQTTGAPLEPGPAPAIGEISADLAHPPPQLPEVAVAAVAEAAGAVDDAEPTPAPAAPPVRRTLNLSGYGRLARGASREGVS